MASTTHASATATATAPPRIEVTDASLMQRSPSGQERRSSLVTVTKVDETPEQLLDQNAGFNANADWVNYKGAWIIHVVILFFAKILLDVLPGMTSDLSWTLVCVGYAMVSYVMFHYVTGTPFESNAGAYDSLTLWEQIDDGAHFTPTKKWLTSLPILLFLIATHYTHYNPWTFSINFIATMVDVFPKLPVLDRLRLKILPSSAPLQTLPPTPNPSRPATPAIARNYSR